MLWPPTTPTLARLLISRQFDNLQLCARLMIDIKHAPGSNGHHSKSAQSALQHVDVWLLVNRQRNVQAAALRVQKHRAEKRAGLHTYDIGLNKFAHMVGNNWVSVDWDVAHTRYRRDMSYHSRTVKLNNTVLLGPSLISIRGNRCKILVRTISTIIYMHKCDDKLKQSCVDVTV